jgi:hypothetical protein
MIRADDVVSLAPGVELRSECLYDPIRGATIPVNPSGRIVLAAPTTPGAAARAVARRFAVDEAGALADVLAFLAELNARLLLNVRPRRGTLALLARWLAGVPALLPLGRFPRAPAARRHVETSRALAALATGTTALARTAVVYAACASGAALLALAALGTARPSFALAAGAGAGIGLLVHELAHLSLLRNVPACVASRGLRVSVLHRRLPAARERAVAAAGPIAGSGAAAATAAAALALVLPELVPAALVLGLQTVGLTVLTRDGRKLCGLP